MDKFLENTYKWVLWVTEINSWIEWKTVWILSITHGNETSWLKAFDALSTLELKEGRMLLICVNIEAYKNWTRMIDIDMNRVRSSKYIEGYELSRYKELSPILKELDYVLDLHSVSIWDDKMVICDKTNIELASKLFDMPYFLECDMEESSAIIWDVFSDWWIWFWIECWNHNSPDWEKIATEAALSLIEYAQLIEEHKNEKVAIDKKYFSFHEEIIPLEEGFMYYRDFNHFEEIRPWEIYATSWKIYHINKEKFSVYIWMMSSNIEVWTSAGFLFKEL